MNSPIPDGSVIITPSEMFAEIRATHDEVKRIGTILDPKLAEIERDIGDHEVRIRSLERKWWGAAGVGTLLGGAAGFLSAILGG